MCDDCVGGPVCKCQLEQKSALKQRVSDIYAGVGGDWGLFVSGLHELNNVGFSLINLPKPINNYKSYVVDGLTEHLFNVGVRA
jgi:hypothetical protein